MAGWLSEIQALLVETPSQALGLYTDRSANPKVEEPSGCVLEKKSYAQI